MKTLWLAFAAALVLGLGFGKAWLHALRRMGVGQPVRSDGPESHFKKRGTPTMGGVAIMLALCAATGAAALTDRSAVAAVPAALASLAFAAVGMLDDALKVRHGNSVGLSPSKKTVALVAVALAYTLILVYPLGHGTDMILPFGGGAATTLPVWLYVPFNVFVFYCATNGANLTDGVDGLASSVTFVASAGMAAAAALLAPRGDAGTAGAVALAAAIAGACASFLAFNAHPAKVFMGDVGSFGLGGAIAACAVLMKAQWALMLFCVAYVAEILSDIVQVAWFKRTGRRVFRMAPLHHHFEKCGWGEWKIVGCWSAATVVGAAAGIAVIVWR